MHVPVDCWDGPTGEPIIFHGHTLTTKIYVEDVCEVIRDYAFLVSPYPIVLSIENHCDLQQQKRIAELMLHYFGGMSRWQWHW
jgi:hypothetical protein